MKEYQYKFPIDDKNAIFEKMKLASLDLSPEVPYKYTYFKLPEGTADSKKTLRIKESPKGSVVDFNVKGDFGDKKVMESEIKDPESMKNILIGVGCKAQVVFRKKRRTFKNEFIRIDLDEIDGLGTFLEVKFKEKGKKKTKEFLTSLGLDMEKGDKRSMIEIWKSPK